MGKLDEIERDIRFFSEVQMNNKEMEELFDHCSYLIDRCRKLEKVVSEANFIYDSAHSKVGSEDFEKALNELD